MSRTDGQLRWGDLCGCPIVFLILSINVCHLQYRPRFLELRNVVPVVP